MRSLLLIDERKGRRVAKEHGLKPVGTLTVLEMAADRELVDLKTAFDALQRTTFHIGAAQINAALQRDAARKPQ
jgi:predicted nucleic acid-binding protein